MGLIGGVATLVAAPVLVSAAGFTTAGVAAGSVAAGIQSAVYGGTVTAATQIYLAFDLRQMCKNRRVLLLSSSNIPSVHLKWSPRKQIPAIEKPLPLFGHWIYSVNARLL